MIFCSKCGNQMSDDATFCNKCGAPVQPAQPAQPQPQYTQPQQPVQPPQAGYPQTPPPQYGQPAPYAQQGMYYIAPKSKAPLIIILVIVAVIAAALAIVLPITLSGGGNNGGGSTPGGNTSGSANVGNNELVGHWYVDVYETANVNNVNLEDTSIGELNTTFTFNSDGTFELTGYEYNNGRKITGTYTASSGTLRLTAEGSTLVGSYYFSGSCLVINIDNVPIAFKR